MGGIGTFEASRDIPRCAPINAVAWGNIEIRVFAINERNKICVTVHHRGRKWVGTTEIAGPSPSARSQFAILQDAERDHENRLQVLYQTPTGSIESCSTADEMSWTITSYPNLCGVMQA